MTENVQTELWKTDGEQEGEIGPDIIDLQDHDDVINQCNNTQYDDTDPYQDVVLGSDHEDDDLCSRDDLNSTVKRSQCDY